MSAASETARGSTSTLPAAYLSARAPRRAEAGPLGARVGGRELRRAPPEVRAAEIAEHEAQGERHIRLLAPLALLSPRIIAAIVNATAPADLTVTGLAKALPYSWAEQERRIGLPL